MSTNDSHVNSDNKNQKVRMPHMFQKRNEELIVVNNDVDSFPEYQQNLSKIVKSYRSYQDNQAEFNTNSLVSDAKKLLDTQTNNEIESLYEYLNTLKGKFITEEEPIVDETEIDIETENNVNINEIMNKAEQEMYTTPDKKSLLKSLIDDINFNSSNKANYDDSQFERNMIEIINETKNEVKDEKLVIEKTNEEDIQLDIEEEPFKKKYFPSIPIIIIFILILFIIVGYLYKDMILEFIQKYIAQLNIQEILNL